MAALSTDKPAPIEPGFHAIHANHLEDLRRAVVYICQHNPMPRCRVKPSWYRVTALPSG